MKKSLENFNKLEAYRNIFSKVIISAFMVGVAASAHAKCSGINCLDPKKNGVSDVAKKVEDGGKNTVNQIKDGTNDALKDVKNESENGVHQINNGFKDGIHHGGGLITLAKTNINNEFKNAKGDIVKGVNDTKNAIEHEISAAEKKLLLEAMKVWKDKTKPMMAGLARNAKALQDSADGKALIQRIRNAANTRVFDAVQLAKDMGSVREQLGMTPGSSKSIMSNLPHAAQQWTVGIGVQLTVAGKAENGASGGGPLTGMFLSDWDNSHMGFSVCGGLVGGYEVDPSAALVFTVAPGNVKDAGSGGYIGVEAGLTPFGAELTWAFDKKSMPKISQAMPAFTLALAPLGDKSEVGLVSGYCGLVWSK